MAGGIGRAQGAYDEMVFRAMVRDGAHFYSNLGLVSKGVGRRLPDRHQRLPVRHPFLQLPGRRLFATGRGGVAEAWRGQRAYYAQQFDKVFGKPLETAWNDWIAWEHEFQAANLKSVRKYPLTQGRRLTRQGLGSVSRSYYDPATNSLIGAFQYPGVVAYTGVVSLADGSIRKLVDIKGPMKYRVTSTAFDPGTRTLFYSADNNAWRDLMAVDVASGKARMLLEDARIGDICFDESDRSLWGLRHLNGYVTLVRIPYPYTQLEPGLYLALRRRALRTRRVGRRLAALDVHRDDRRHTVLECVPPCRPRGRQSGTRRPVRFRQGHPGRLRIHPRWPLSVRQLLLHRRFQHFPLRARDRRTRSGQQRGNRLLPADPDGRWHTDRPGVHRGRLRADDHRAEAAGGCQRHHLPRSANREKAPDRPGVGRRLRLRTSTWSR